MTRGLGTVARAAVVAVALAVLAWEFGAAWLLETCAVVESDHDVDVMRVDHSRCRLRLTCESGPREELASKPRHGGCPPVGGQVLWSPGWIAIPPLIRTTRPVAVWSGYPLSMAAAMALILSWNFLGRLSPPAPPGPLDPVPRRR